MSRDRAKLLAIRGDLIGTAQVIQRVLDVDAELGQQSVSLKDTAAKVMVTLGSISAELSK